MVKRRRIKARTNQVSAAAVAAWKARDDIALRYELGSRPWDFSPLEVDDGKCPYPGFSQQENWRKAQELRAALEAAANDLEPSIVEM